MVQLCAFLLLSATPAEVEEDLRLLTSTRIIIFDFISHHAELAFYPLWTRLLMQRGQLMVI